MASKAGNASEEKKENKKTLIVIIIALLALLVIALLVIIALLLGKNQGGASVGDAQENTQTREVANSGRVVLDSDTAKSVYEEMREEVAEGMFECEMSTTWTFDDGEAKSKDAYVANSVNNTHPIYFDVYLKDTNELIYSSPVLPVGTNLTDFSLDKELSAGTYKATVFYSLLKDEESQDVISSAGFVITIMVLK